MAKPLGKISTLAKGLRVWAVMYRVRLKRFTVPSLHGVTVVDVVRFFSQSCKWSHSYPCFCRCF